MSSVIIVIITIISSSSLPPPPPPSLLSLPQLWLSSSSSSSNPLHHRHSHHRHHYLHLSQLKHLSLVYRKSRWKIQKLEITVKKLKTCHLIKERRLHTLQNKCSSTFQSWHPELPPLISQKISRSL